MQVIYGFPQVPMPLDIDFVNYSNEDQGFNASLVPGTNDNQEIALPYPATLDLFDETIRVHALEFILAKGQGYDVGTVPNALTVWLSMLDRSFTVSWFGELADADDEAMKAQFAGPMQFGTTRAHVTGTAALGDLHNSDSVNNILYYPPVPLDLVTPLFITLVNSSFTITLLTNAKVEVSFTRFEQVVIRTWFNRRPLTPAEMQSRNMAIRFQRLDS